MNDRTTIFRIGLLASVLWAGAYVACAQDQPQPQPTPDNPQEPAPDTPPFEPMPGAPPKPAGYAFPGLSLQEGDLQSDFSPLTGMQNFTLGIPEMGHSYFVPGLQFSSNLQSSPNYVQGGGTNWSANNYFLGNASLLEAWGRTTLAVNYTGGGFVSSDSSQGNGVYQQLALAQNYRGERWLIQIVDQFAYVPQSSFGFGGGTNLGIPGVGGSLGLTIPGLGGNYVPNQSIYGVGPFYTNAGALQATYALSHRSSLTASGSYGILSFTQSANSDSNVIVGSIGYNYVLGRNDTIGLVYRFSGYHFPGNPQAYGDQVLSVAYGRKVTGHLAIRLFAGPEFTQYRIPFGNQSSQVGFSASANLTYGFERGGFSVGYLHGVSGGSGVLIGSVIDEVTATASRRLTRAWSGYVNFGYSHNSALGGSAQTGNPVYDSLFAGGGVSRPIGRAFNFGLAYTTNLGENYAAGCVGSGCNASSTNQTVTLSLQWHPRPFVLR